MNSSGFCDVCNSQNVWISCGRTLGEFYTSKLISKYQQRFYVGASFRAEKCRPDEFPNLCNSCCAKALRELADYLEIDQTVEKEPYSEHKGMDVGKLKWNP